MKTQILRTSLFSLYLVFCSINYFKSQIIIGKTADVKVIFSAIKNDIQLTTDDIIFSAGIEKEKMTDLQLSFKSGDLKGSSEKFLKYIQKIIHIKKTPYISIISKSNVVKNNLQSVNARMTITNKTNDENLKISITKYDTYYLVSGSVKINLLNYGININKDLPEYKFNNWVEILFSIKSEMLNN